MATIGVYLPTSAEFGTATYPQLTQVGTSPKRPVLAFDATTGETAYWTGVVPAGFTGTPTAIVYYIMASATTGGVAFDVAVESVTAGDAVDLDAGASFDSVNGGSDASVQATAGYLDTITCTLTNRDSMAAGDYVRYSLARDVADAADTATGDCYVLALEIRDGS